MWIDKGRVAVPKPSRVPKGRVRLPNRMNFRKSVCVCGGGSFSIQKFKLQIFGTLNTAFSS